MFVFKLLLILLHMVGVLRWIIKLWFYDNNKLTSGLHVLLTEFRILIRSANDFIAYRFLTLNIWDIISVLSMRLVMFVRISRCPEYQSSYLPFEENHAQTKCANLTTETVFKLPSLAQDMVIFLFSLKGLILCPTYGKYSYKDVLYLNPFSLLT